MRAPCVAALVTVLVAVAAAPAGGAARTIDVQITAHLRSDYRFSYDYVDTSSPDCPQTIRASSRVITDMTTVRPARFRVSRTAAGHAFHKRGGGRQRADRAIDMRAEMTRSTEGGSETPCYGYEPYPTANCGTRGWALDGRPGMGRGRFFVSPEIPVFPSIQRVMEDEEWRDGGCGYDSTGAHEWITVSYDNRGRVKSPYMAPIAIKRLFRPGRRTVRVRDSHSFTQGHPDQFGGGFTEVRTIEVTIRKLR
jgi:hypothetical protein